MNVQSSQGLAKNFGQHPNSSRHISRVWWLLAVLVLVLVEGQPGWTSGEGRAGHWRSGAQGAPKLKECFRRVKTSPESAVAHNDLGWALRQKGDLTGAERALREALHLNPTLPEAHSNMSVVCLDRGQIAPALSEAQMAVSLRPDSPVFLVVLGNAYLAKQEAKQAITSYQQALKLQPDYQNAYYHLGRAYLAAGEQDEAKQSFSKAIELDPQDERVLKVLDELMSGKKVP